MNAMSDDAKAILLLAGQFGSGKDGIEPLALKHYNPLVHWLVERDQRPADLLAMDDIGPAAKAAGVEESRIKALLGRGVQLGFAVEQWNRSGIWVICRGDAEYPGRYRSRLKDDAPPVLFGVGDKSLLEGGGVAMVGSRDVDEVGENLARDVAAWCARSQVPVVSGGARGVDQAAMQGALEAGGCVIGVLADNLLRASVAKETRRAIADGCLLLLSPYHPQARSTAWAALARNKCIYAMADMGLVVSSDVGKGGTWSGAKEELERKPAQPVFVMAGEDAPKGNRKLQELGAAPFPIDWRDRDFKSVVAGFAARKAPPAEKNLLLFPDEPEEERPDDEG